MTEAVFHCYRVQWRWRNPYCADFLQHLFKIAVEYFMSSHTHRLTDVVPHFLSWHMLSIKYNINAMKHTASWEARFLTS